MSLTERLAARGADLTGITTEKGSEEKRTPQGPAAKRRRRKTSEPKKRALTTAALVPLERNLSCEFGAGRGV